LEGKTMKIEAVGYCRVSSVGQQNTGSGLGRQEATIRAYAKKAGYKIVKVYREAFTGTETERPVFEDMLAEILGDGCRTIIVESLDRLARDLAVQMQVIALLTSSGVALLNASTGQNVTEAMEADPMMRAMVQMQGTFAELDKRLLVRKLKKGRQAKLEKNGYCEGRKPFGYRPSEQETLNRIKQLHRKLKGEKRRGPYEIANILNKENLPTRAGGKWTGPSVSGIIKRMGWSTK
jgi:DNA invertase Pin-like site-specific DNA recombinase